MLIMLFFRRSRQLKLPGKITKVHHSRKSVEALPIKDDSDTKADSAAKTDGFAETGICNESA